jgi:hypothetical protein
MRAKQQHVCKEMNQYTKMYDQYQPEMDYKFRHRMDNRSEVHEISLFFNSTCPVNSIAKEIFWAEIYWEQLFSRAEIYRG